MWEELEKKGHIYNLICTYEAWENSHILLPNPSSSEVGSGGRMPWLQDQRSGKACFARGDLFISSTFVTNGNHGEYGFLPALHIRNTAVWF